MVSFFKDAYTVPAVPETRPTACILGQLEPPIYALEFYVYVPAPLLYFNFPSSIMLGSHLLV